MARSRDSIPIKDTINHNNGTALLLLELLEHEYQLLQVNLQIKQNII